MWRECVGDVGKGREGKGRKGKQSVKNGRERSSPEVLHPGEETGGVILLFSRKSVLLGEMFPTRYKA